MGLEIIKDYWTMIVFAGGMIVMFAKMKSSSENNTKSAERNAARIDALDAELEKTKHDVNSLGSKVNAQGNDITRLDEAQKTAIDLTRDNDKQLFLRVNENSEAIATIKESVRCLEREKFSPKK